MRKSWHLCQTVVKIAETIELADAAREEIDFVSICRMPAEGGFDGKRNKSSGKTEMIKVVVGS